MLKIKQKRKLVKDCKPGDLLYMVKYDRDLPDYIHDSITRIVIREIVPGTEFSGGDLIRCEYISVFNANTEYEFRHMTSDHDDLLLDTDFLYCDGKYEGCRCYTSYQGALDYLVHSIQYNVMKQLERLETISETLGISENQPIDISTTYVTNGDRRYKKKEIYDTGLYPEDSICTIKKSFKPVKTEVRRTHVELDALGRTKHNVYSWDEKFREFDTQEEANKWIFENDESRWPCESGKSFFEGYRYYIKKRSIYDK
jgi:hypothetical protein